MNQPLIISALTFVLEGGVIPTEAHLLPPNDFKTDDGRAALGMLDSFKFNPSIGAKVVSAFAKKQNDTVVDYEHQTLLAAVNGKEAPAAGWFNRLEYRDTGLWATGIKWTAKAKAYLKNNEYRYISAVFSHTPEGVITGIVNFTLTNTPALDGLQSLASLSVQNNFNQQIHTGDNTMSGQDVAALTAQNTQLTQQVTALTTERDQANAKVTALTAERDALQGKVTEIEKQAAAEKEAAEKKAHADLLQTALTDGRLMPKQKEWAEKQSLAELTAFLETAPVIINNQLQHDPKHEGGTGEHGLTEVELAHCTMMRIDPKLFAEEKALNKR